MWTYLVCCFSIVLYACLGQKSIPLVSWAWGAFGISYTKKNHYNFFFTELRRKVAVFLCQNLIMRCYVTILAEIYDDPTFFGSGPGFVDRTQSDPGFVNPIRSDPVQVLMTPSTGKYWLLEIFKFLLHVTVRSAWSKKTNVYRIS